MSQSLQHINWAILGCGQIANTFMKSMRSVKGASVIACAAREGERAKAFAQTYSIPEHYGDYAEMLQDRRINAVYIATTHNFHFEQIILCLQHGKHVLCEKPLTLNATQAAKAFTLAEQNGLLLVEAVWTRFLPAIKAVKAIITSGEIGDVLGMQCNFSLNLELPDTHRLKALNLAGGALLDLGIYPITMADIVFDQAPVSITSSVMRANTGVDQNSFYTLEYANGATAQLSAGFKMGGPTQALIMGDKGHIVVPFFLGAKEFEVCLEGEPSETHSYDFPQTNDFTFEIQHVSDCLLAHNYVSNIMPSNTTLRVMTIMDTIRQQWGLRYPAED
jgi:predicted dehydrogenase